MQYVSFGQHYKWEDDVEIIPDSVGLFTEFIGAPTSRCTG